MISAIYRMLEAERSFARTSVTSGTRTALSEYLAGSSLILNDGWTETERNSSFRCVEGPY